MATQRSYSAEEAVKRLNELSPEIHDFIYSQEWGDILNKIGDKNKLHLDQLGALEYETAALVLGFTEPADFPKIILESLSLSPEEASVVATDINELLLGKIRKNMMSASIPEKTQSIQTKESSGDPLRTQELLSPKPASELPSHITTALTEPSTQIVSRVSIPETTPIPQNKQEGEATAYKIDPYREPIE